MVWQSCLRTFEALNSHWVPSQTSSTSVKTNGFKPLLQGCGKLPLQVSQVLNVTLQEHRWIIQVFHIVGRITVDFILWIDPMGGGCPFGILVLSSAPPDTAKKKIGANSMRPRERPLRGPIGRHTKPRPIGRVLLGGLPF